MRKKRYTFEEVERNECNWLASVDWKSNLERLEKIPRKMNSSSNQFDVNVRLSLVLNFDYLITYNFNKINICRIFNITDLVPIIYIYIYITLLLRRLNNEKEKRSSKICTVIDSCIFHRCIIIEINWTNRELFAIPFQTFLLDTDVINVRFKSVRSGWQKLE